MSKRGNLVGLILSLVTIIIMLLNLDWDATMETFANVNGFFLIAAFLMYLLNYVFRTLRFQVLLELENHSFPLLYGVTSLYGMFLYVMPAKSGEISYPLLLKNQLKISLPESTATLITARLFDFATLALFIPVALISFWEKIPPWLRSTAIIFTAAILILSLCFLWFVRHNKRFSKNHYTSLESRSVVLRLKNGVNGLIFSLKEINKRNIYLRLWLITIAIWIFLQTNFYFIVLSLGFRISFFQMLVISIIMVPLTLLPVQGFANLGTHEIGWATAFTLFGFSQSSAINIAFSSHIIFFVFVLCLGLLGLIILKLSARKS
jgi:uncharacterized protein (TIRG00374 family)